MQHVSRSVPLAGPFGCHRPGRGGAEPK